jgi:hypothetical protein
MLAARVRELRCGPICHSWRRIAEIIAEEYPNLDIVPENQLEGQDLCRQSAAFFGEDPNEEPWN